MNFGEGELILAKQQVFLRHHDLPFRFGDGRVRTREVGFGHPQGFGGLVRVRLRNRSCRGEFGHALVIELGLGQHRLGAGEVGTHSLRRLFRRRQRGCGNGDLLFRFRIVEPGEELPGFHGVSLIHPHL